jgi:uncharacterized membrane protein
MAYCTCAILAKVVVDRHHFHYPALTWDEIGRVAAIAAIRTFLTFFLDRDIDAARDSQRRSRGGNDAKHA